MKTQAIAIDILNNDITLLKDDEDVTDIEFLELFGYPVATTNMSELKKKGQIARIEQLQILIFNFLCISG